MGLVRKNWGRISKHSSTGLRASREMQSIVTGQIKWPRFLSDKPAKFAEFRIETQTRRYPRSHSYAGAYQKVEKIPIDEIFAKILAAVEGIQKCNSPEIPETIHSINEAVKEIKPLGPISAKRERCSKARAKCGQSVGPLARPLRDVNDYGKLARTPTVRLIRYPWIGGTIKEIQKAVSSIEKTLWKLNQP